MSNELFTNISSRLLNAEHVAIYGPPEKAYYVFNRAFRHLPDDAPVITIRHGRGNDRIELENGATIRTFHSEQALRGLVVDLFVALKPLSYDTERILKAHGAEVIPVDFDNSNR